MTVSGKSFGIDRSVPASTANAGSAGVHRQLCLTNPKVQAIMGVREQGCNGHFARTHLQSSRAFERRIARFIVWIVGMQPAETVQAVGIVAFSKSRLYLTVPISEAECRKFLL
jgi:hypothetical protein